MILYGDQVRLLCILSEDAGLVTRQVAVRAHGNANLRSDSQVIRLKLLSLQRLGLAGTLDYQKPVCWTRTAKGTEELRNIERQCPCGANPESFETRPHQDFCSIGEALGSPTVTSNRVLGVKP